MIVLKDITKIYDLGKGSSLTAVHEINLEICRNEFAVLVGRSGSGKTTLLNLTAGLTRPTSGQVCVDGVDLWTLNDQQQSALRNKKIGFVFQFPSLLPALTVYENVLMPASFTAEQRPNEVHERVLAMLDSVGLSQKLDAYPRQLSAGQQQRVVVARALMNRPEIILADEPTSNLDEKTELEIMDLLHDLHVRLGLTILLVTHTTQLVTAEIRKIEMAEGQIVNQSAAAVNA